jgi:tRNA A37 threonylcarbamoyltransferase TsaD
MSDNESTLVEEQAAEETAEKASASGTSKAETWRFSEFAASLRTAVSRALADRTNVVMVRVNDETLRYLDMLVEAEICKSRSESAAFLIAEGVKANTALYERISDVTEQIAELRRQLREIVGGEGKPAGEQAA